MKKSLTILLLILFISMQNVSFAEMVIKQDANGVYYVEEVENTTSMTNIETQPEGIIIPQQSQQQLQQVQIQYDKQLKSAQDLEDEADYQAYKQAQDLEDEADYQAYEQAQVKEEKKSVWKKIGTVVLVVGAITGIVFLSMGDNSKNKDNPKN